MKTLLQTAVLLIFAATMGAGALVPVKEDSNARDTRNDASANIDDKIAAQPKLLRISANVDGSGRIIFTRDGVRYEHKYWDEPTDVSFDGEPWEDLSKTPPAWQDVVSHLDLTKAWIVKRQGRDVIALEQTPDGFDLYLCDSPNGAERYEVTIAIPRRH